MADSATIPNAPPLNPALDYAFLRKEGVSLLQCLSSSIWTDYNEHDPGVTTLEQLCYALTELAYRAELPVTQLLADPATATIQPHRHGLFLPRRILPCNPVTIDDYRKLIVDRVPGVANVWLAPLSSHNDNAVKGLYDILAYIPAGTEVSHDQAAEQIFRVYNRHRNLCENVGRLRILEARSIAVHAEVDLGRDVLAETPELILARIFFAIESLLAPELRRRPLAALIREDEPADEIFDGPLMTRGFIDDSQLLPRALSVPVNDIIATIAAVEGIAGSRNVYARLRDDETIYKLNDSVPVGPREYLHLETRPSHHHRHFSIRLLRDGVPCTPDPAQVTIQLRLLWDHYRSVFPLDEQYSEFFPLPSANWQDLTRYYSIQNQYPGVYGINSFGVAAGASTERIAQARQLKGYLLPFEQLMSNFFAQIADIKNLFSLDPDSRQTYAYQSLLKSVPDVAPILKDNYLDGLARLVSRDDPSLERRNRFLDFLLSLYASPLNPAALEQTGNGSDTLHRQERIVQAKRALLRTLVASTRDRGRAFDYLGHPIYQNLAGMQIRCRIELGLGRGQHRSLNNLLAEAGMHIGHSRLDTSVYESIDPHAIHLEQRSRPASSFPPPAHVPPAPISLRGRAASNELIAAARRLDCLFIGTMPGGEVAIICKLRFAGWIVIDRFSDLETALREAYAIARHCQRLHRAKKQLYVVEHNLLRHGHSTQPGDSPFVYDFTLTAVLGASSRTWYSPSKRTSAFEIIRQNTPAHIVSDICFLQPRAMVLFEHLYFAWLESLREGPHARLEATSTRLRRFLIRHTARKNEP
jgi:hypothetical protein